MNARRLLVSALLALTVVPATADAAVPDKWTRWKATPADATVRSLDFIGVNLFAASQEDGVFSSPSTAGPWNQQNGGLDTPSSKQVYQAKVSPSGAVYAATSGGLFKSATGMGGWQPVGQGPGPRKLSMGGVQSIVFNGSDQDMAVAVSGAAGAGVYYSSDGGANWDRAKGMPSLENVYSLTQGKVPNPIYAAADDGVFVSADAGRNWTLASDGIPPSGGVFRIAISTEDPTHLYASTSSSVYTSSNLGATWEEKAGTEGQTLPAGNNRAFLLAPPSDGKFAHKRALVGTQSGVYVTLDDGLHWNEMSGDANVDPNIDDQPDPNMGDRVVESLGLGFTPPALMAGTHGFGTFWLPLQPIGDVVATIAPASGLKPGSVLTAAVSASGTKPYVFTYVWKRCTGAGCTPSAAIAGATAATYAIPTSDANKRVRYMVTVSASNLVSPTAVNDDSNITADADTAPLAGSEPYPKSPFPSISPAGSQEIGTTFTINEGSWRTDNTASITPDSFRYRWSRCDDNGNNCVVVPSETGKTYVSSGIDVAKRMKAEVQGTKSNVTGDWANAGQTSLIKNKIPVNDVKPKIVGDAFTGETLSSSAGGWDGYDLRYERRWLRCNSDGVQCNPTNPVNTTSTYTVTAADKGSRLELEVKAIGEDPTQDREMTVTSDLTAVITDRPVVAEPTVTPTGTPTATATPTVTPTSRLTVQIKKPKKLKKGAKLKLALKLPGASKLRYQWLRNGKKIKKATKSSYRITKKDKGKKLSCRISFTVGGVKKTLTTKAIKVPRKK